MIQLYYFFKVDGHSTLVYKVIQFSVEEPLAYGR